MTIAQASKAVGNWCASCARDLLLVALWLALGGLIIAQLGIWSSREIPMPGWLLRRFEARLADVGLRATIGAATVNSTGHVRIEKLQVMQRTDDSPLLTAANVRLSLNLRALAGGVFESQNVEAGGVTLWLPAMLSPSGQAEPVASDISLALSKSRERLTIRRLDGRLARLPVSMHGEVDLPKTMLKDQRLDHRALAGRLVKQYLRACRQLAEFETKFTGFDRPHLDAVLVPAGPQAAMVSATFTADAADINLAGAAPKLGRVQLSWLRTSTAFALVATRGQAARLAFSCSQARSSTGAELLNLSASLEAWIAPRFAGLEGRQLTLTCDSATVAPVIAQNTSARLTPGTDSRVHAEVIARALGTDWSVRAAADPRKGEGTAHVDGAVTPWMLGFLARRTGLPPSKLVEIQEPAPFSADLELAEGWKPDSIQGHIVVGALVGYHVPFDSVSGTFSLKGSRLRVYDMTGRQGEHFAWGSYEMDTRSLDYRFLLAGRLRPMGIAGYFQEWWPNFWKNFDFAGGIPEASVDVTGRWKEPRLSTVFVRADVAKPLIRTVPFDRVRTSLFIRPEFYDGLELAVDRSTGSATGTFTRTIDLTRRDDALRVMTFDIISTLDLTEAARLFGTEGAEIVAPFRFEQPPTLRLLGQIDGGASATGPRRVVALDLKSTGGFALHDFPLQDLSFKGTIRDETIDLQDILVSFAHGQASGRAFVHGREKNRQLRFDVSLQGAALGESIRTLEEFFARLKGQSAPQESRFQQRLADGRVKMNLAAEGFYQDPLSFRGRGAIELAGAQLAQINLLGALSAVLSKSSLFSFTSLQLHTARSSIGLDRTKLSLPDLRITGPSAAIEAKGAVELDRKEMEFNAKVYPFGQGKTLLADAVGFVLTPLSNALELKLTGTIDKPDWRFAYGPTNFLHTISGTKPGQFREPTVPAGDRKLPAPYLRH